MARAISTRMTLLTPGSIRNTCLTPCGVGGTIDPLNEAWRLSCPEGWTTGVAGERDSADLLNSRWHRLCGAGVRRCSMKGVLLTATALLIAVPAMAAPGDPRALRGSLEWPASLSAEPFIVVRGEDGGIYYADVSGARRMSTAAIAGPISLLGIEGNQPHEIAAVVVGAGDSALNFARPSVPPPAQIAPVPSSLPRETATPMPQVAVPPLAATVPPPGAPPAAPAAPQVVVAPEPSGGDDLWRVQGKITALSARDFVGETGPGETVHVDVSKLSSWIRESVRAGDQVKLFGIPQTDQRLVANGFIQEVPAKGSSSR